MLDISRQAVHDGFQARAYIVEFHERAKREREDAVFVAEPRCVTAALTSVEPERAGAAASAPGALKVLLLPLQQAAQSLAIEQEAKAWIAIGEQAGGRIVRASSRTARAIWTPTHAVLYTGDEHARDALDAMVRFTVAEREIAHEEKGVREFWPSMDVDADLANALAKSGTARPTRLKELTRLAAGFKASSLRVWMALEQLDPGLSAPSKLLFAELSLAAAQEDRQDLLDDPIQFAHDHYEIANTRMIDNRNASKENRNFVIEIILQIVIVALLCLELLAMYGVKILPGLPTPV